MLGCFDAVLVALARRLALPVATADRLLLTACGADALPSGRHGWTPSPGHDPPSSSFLAIGLGACGVMG